MTLFLLVPIAAPMAAATLALVLGWRRLTAVVTVLAALLVLVSGAVLSLDTGSGARFAMLNLFRVDALSVTMLIVIGTVGTLAQVASVPTVPMTMSMVTLSASTRNRFSMANRAPDPVSRLRTAPLTRTSRAARTVTTAVSRRQPRTSARVAAAIGAAMGTRRKRVISRVARSAGRGRCH